MVRSVCDRAEGHGFVDLSFLIHDQSPVMRGEHCVETYRLSVCLGDVRFEPDLKLVLGYRFPGQSHGEGRFP